MRYVSGTQAKLRLAALLDAAQRSARLVPPGHMRDHAPAHAKRVEPFFAVIHAIADPLDGEAIAGRFDRVIAGDPMVAPVGGGFGVVPFERLILHLC